MASMSYCLFQNTASELDRCEDSLEALFNDVDSSQIDSLEEREAAVRLVATCARIIDMMMEWTGADDVADVNNPAIRAAIKNARKVAAGYCDVGTDGE
jgi:hypothetical protein